MPRLFKTCTNNFLLIKSHSVTALHSHQDTSDLDLSGEISPDFSTYIEPIHVVNVSLNVILNNDYQMLKHQLHCKYMRISVGKVQVNPVDYLIYIGKLQVIPPNTTDSLQVGGDYCPPLQCAKYLQCIRSINLCFYVLILIKITYMIDKQRWV